MNPELEKKIEGLPRQPGIYQHKDAEGNVLYVGKAKDLRSRIRSYFRESRPHDGRMRIMIRKIEDVEVIVTDTEAEALILENNLIKHLKPRYNVLLRDDKTFPFICIRNERFPRVFPTRRIVRDGSKYFGPYTDVKNMHLMLRTIRSIFQLRTCTLNLAPEPIAAGKYDPCLEYHIKKCAAPCTGQQSEEDYNRTIEQVEKLLNGHTKELIALLRDEMERLSDAMLFEEAAGLRDRILALEKYARKQKVVSEDEADRDLFAMETDERENVACGVIFQVREGKVIGRRHTYIHPIEGLSKSVLMQRLVEDYYADAVFFPGEVLLSGEIAEPEPVKELLAQQRGRNVPLAVPRRGPKASLMRMVSTNAAMLLEEWKIRKMKRGEDRIPHAVRSLEEDLRLETLPRRIECFDISHLAGTGTVASCVVFRDGRPRKSEYRHYKIRSAVSGQPDDYQSMREVVTRRYANRENIDWPDLVVIDGGKGQLSAAADALREIGVYGRFPLIGLAKRLEEVFFPGDSAPLHIPKASTSLQLLQRIRNEAHRFAVTFQRAQRKKRTLHTSLREIDGVGEKTAQKLIRRFGSVKRVEAAGEEALREAVGAATAQKITAFFDAKRGDATSQRSA
ncbi:MAG: excinuclease ABC subunit C [Bacteroidetes bacterium SB0662_bin_6]|nr:excinuclease ABC subunit C [Bacteroidetes bacterium SB0668_bin_1]MYE04087.1 excinuclease ABC subunit C [Bacteroidetes bacterium SB0662_bin_6]